MDIDNQKLINLAIDVLDSRKINDSQVGQVASALITDKGTIYRGVCMDLKSGVGFCAERAAIAQMITFGEEKVKKIVAVHNNGSNEVFRVLAPCGVCRHFMTYVTIDGQDIDVILPEERTVKLKELMPENEWPE